MGMANHYITPPGFDAQVRPEERMKLHVLISWVLWASLTAPAQAFDWQPATPQSQGLSAEKLESLRADLAQRGTHALLVIRHDRIVLEFYADGYSADKPHGTASLAKAAVGGMSMAIAMQDG